MTTVEIRESVQRLNKDIKDAAAELSEREARFLVDTYYSLQRHRIEAQNQTRALDESKEPYVLLAWLFDQHYTLEREIQKVLNKFTDEHPAGRWAKSITGIGPVLAGGLLAHIDIEQAPTVGHIWRFGGYDPTLEWKKGEKRPFNASLKVLYWKIGESFVKVQSRPTDIYGQIYAHRKELEQQRNESGLYADQAAGQLEQKKYRKTTDAYAHYTAGRLPPAHIYSRAKRSAVEIFLAHLHHVVYESRYGKPPPKPYILTHSDHTHYLAPPNWPLED